jgi:hypothetical protein
MRLENSLKIGKSSHIGEIKCNISLGSNRMGQAHAYAAIDLGAESGRVVKGILQDGTLHLEEINRFKNSLVPIGGQVTHTCKTATWLKLLAIYPR